MAEMYPILDFFGEDAGHESFFRALVVRLAEEVETPPIEVRPRSNRGGHGRALTELRGWLRSTLVERGQLLVVMIDANAFGWARQRRAIEAAIPPDVYPLVVIGCPEPEVESWMLSDPDALARTLGVNVQAAAGHEDPKRALAVALEAAGLPIVSAPMTIAYEVVPEMDLHKAGRVAPSLRHFVDELRGALTRLREL